MCTLDRVHIIECTLDKNQTFFDKTDDLLFCSWRAPENDYSVSIDKQIKIYNFATKRTIKEIKQECLKGIPGYRFRVNRKDKTV